MTKDLATVHLGQKLSEVRALFSENSFHHVPVVSGEKLLGVISSTDIMKAGFGTNSEEIDVTLDHTASIETVMQSNPVTISSSASVKIAAETLADGDFHSLPVVEGEVLVGIVTSTDLIRYLLDNL